MQTFTTFPSKIVFALHQVGLQDEKEALQSQIHWLKKAVRQQEYDKQALEKQLQQYKAAADHCQVEDL